MDEITGPLASSLTGSGPKSSSRSSSMEAGAGPLAMKSLRMALILAVSSSVKTTVRLSLVGRPSSLARSY